MSTWDRTAAGEALTHELDGAWLQEADRESGEAGEAVIEGRARAGGLLLHALLERTLGRAAEGDAARLTRTLAALRKEPVGGEAAGSVFDQPWEAAGTDVEAAAEPAREVAETPTRFSPAPRRRRTVLLTALALSVGAFVATIPFWPAHRGEAANRVLEQAVAAAEDPVDRQYQVTGTGRNGPWSWTLDLYVRGGDRFALRAPAPLGTELWCGSDGSEFWFVPVVNPVLVGPEPDVLKQWYERGGPELPVMQLSTILRRLEERYALEVNSGEGGRTELRGVLRERGSLFPEQVRVVLDETSGIAEQVTLAWPSRSGEDPGPRELVFTLVEASPRSDDWYQHAGHHGPNRTVLDLGAMEAP
jgi:hypothetical protein